MTTCVFFPILMAAALSAPQIPEALKAEHEHLHEALVAAMKLPGETGKAATRVADLLHPHFVKEEEFALPPLGALRQLASGREADVDVRNILALSQKLKTELPRMLEEHKGIVGALDSLSRAAKAESHPDVLAFVEQLEQHAHQEEQVLYPAAVLVGEYLKLKQPH